MARHGVGIDGRRHMRVRVAEPCGDRGRGSRLDRLVAVLLFLAVELDAPPPKTIVDRIDQIDREITSEHWETLTKTRPLRLPP